jgi:hypothetical protein
LLFKVGPRREVLMNLNMLVEIWHIAQLSWLVIKGTNPKKFCDEGHVTHEEVIAMWGLSRKMVIGPIILTLT